jgi:hypothetical protein
MKTKVCYSYHPETFEYVGEETAYECQIVENDFLLPASATFVSPPSIELVPKQYFKWNGEEWVVENRPDLPVETEAEITLEEHWKNLRRKRNKLLAETDHYFLRDRILTPDNELEMSIYRQNLRDLPQNTIDPSNPSWPIRPSLSV